MGNVFADTKILQTDDVGIFLSPLSQEYLLAAEHFGLNRDDLIDICKATSETIFASKDEAARIREKITAFRAEIPRSKALSKLDSKAELDTEAGGTL